MSKEEVFLDRYMREDIPWDIGRPDFNLISFVEANAFNLHKALDIGCGTGDNAIWLARKGIKVVGIDCSDIAIGKAKNKLGAENNCEFYTIDFGRQQVPGALFDFVFDRGCFHTIEGSEERKTFSLEVNTLMVKNGLWLSLIGSADDDREGEGPPKRSVTEIATAVEEYFEIISIIKGVFDSNAKRPPIMWKCLMRKRN